MKKSGKKEPVFINGFLYYSFFIASIETGISSVSFWKTLKLSKGKPATIRRNFIVPEIWIETRKAAVKMEYGL